MIPIVIIEDMEDDFPLPHQDDRLSAKAEIEKTLFNLNNTIVTQLNDLKQTAQLSVGMVKKTTSATKYKKGCISTMLNISHPKIRKFLNKIT